VPKPQIVVGLGNPGPEYAGSRHNVGHAVVERLGADLGARFRRRGPAQVAEALLHDPPLYLAKLLAVMNVSGPSAARLLQHLDLTPPALILVYDDLDLPFGRVRVRAAGRHGGHNGVRSVIETLGTDRIRRVKVGIGRPEGRDPETVADWVLTPFSPEEAAALPPVLERAAQAALALATRP
jgi:peptidyl-tRNA hydrolase, PTH1 family